MSTLPAAPTPLQMDRLGGVLAPLARVTSPHVDGLGNLPDRPALYVGNHTRFAFLDLPFMISELWQKRQIVVRSLGDHGHYAIPVWRDLLTLCGMVRGTRENVRDLMSTGENVLVFPGGAGEVFKGKGLDYQLIWKERLGFAKLAIEYGYPIVPFSAVGAEEMYDVMVDNTMPGVAQISALMKRLVGLPIPPIPRGIGPTLLPRPERLYFSFSTPISTDRFAGDAHERNARVVRDEVRTAVLAGIDRLKRLRADDPDRDLVRRLRGLPEAPVLATADPNAYFVTRAFEAWNAHGPNASAAWLAPTMTLTDPPDWPGSTTWPGRDAALARLTEVSSILGGAHVSVIDAHSSGTNEVDVTFEVRKSATSRPLGRFAMNLTLAKEQIASVHVQIKSDGLSAGPSMSSP